MWRATWLIEPTTDEVTKEIDKIPAGVSRGFAVQSSAMSDDESVAVEMLLNDHEGGCVWEPVMVQGCVMTLTAAYNQHTFTGPITLRFVKPASAAAFGVSDFES